MSGVHRRLFKRSTARSAEKSRGHESKRDRGRLFSLTFVHRLSLPVLTRQPWRRAWGRQALSGPRVHGGLAERKRTCRRWMKAPASPPGPRQTSWLALRATIRRRLGIRALRENGDVRAAVGTLPHLAGVRFISSRAPLLPPTPPSVPWRTPLIVLTTRIPTTSGSWTSCVGGSAALRLSRRVILYKRGQ